MLLSVQCLDEKVVQRLAALKEKKLLTVEALVTAKAKEVAQTICCCNLVNKKTAYILQCARIIVSEHDGKVPSSQKELLDLPGVGAKIAAVVPHEAFDIVENPAIDCHMFIIFWSVLHWADPEDKSEPEVTA